MPGALSRRTDGGPADKQPMRQLTDAAYGEQKTFREDQAGAPMAKAPQGGGIQPLDMSGVTPLNAPTAFPNEAVTTGASLGPGGGMDTLGLPQPSDDPGFQALRNQLPGLELMANLPSSSRAFRDFVRQLRASL
jgi:hypothetical protein